METTRFLLSLDVRWNTGIFLDLLTQCPEGIASHVLTIAQNRNLA